MVAVALVLGIIASLTMPKRYTAEAFIREGLAAEFGCIGLGHRGP